MSACHMACDASSVQHVFQHSFCLKEFDDGEYELHIGSSGCPCMEQESNLMALHCGKQAGYQVQAIHDTRLPKRKCGHAGNAIGRTYAYCKEASQCQGAHDQRDNEGQRH